MSCSGSPMGFGVVAVHVCLLSSQDGAVAAPVCPHCLQIALWAGEARLKGSLEGGNNDEFFFFLHSFLPEDKYQPTEVLKADIELVAPADLPPVRGMDIVCGRRGQTASALQCQHPAPPQPSPLKGGIEEPV